MGTVVSKLLALVTTSKMAVVDDDPASAVDNTVRLIHYPL
jgi:hypothetical protein